MSLAHWFSSPVPPSLLGATSAYIAVFASISATSAARTETSSPASRVLAVTTALAELLTFELATTAPTLMPAAPNAAAGAEVAELPTSE